jgi:hypothetical protein
MDEYNTLYENMKDEDIVKLVQKWCKESNSYHEQLLHKQDKSVTYYEGNQTSREIVPQHGSTSTYNRVFEATETILPVVTGGAHLFLVAPGDETDVSRNRAHKLQKVLNKKYDDLDIPGKLELADRDVILKRFGVLKYFWNPRTNDVDVKTVDPRLILIPKLRMEAHELPYVIELQEYDYSDMEMYFPDKKPEDLTMKKTKVEGSNSDIFEVKEVWTDEYVCWVHEDQILKKMPNPHFDFEGTEEKVVNTDENGRIKKKTYRRFANHFDYPQKPYIFLTPFRTGDSPVANISLSEVAIPIQDDINTSKRQILDNLKSTGNAQILIDSDAFTDEETAQSITNEPGLVIIGKGVASEGKIRREPAVPLPASHFNNLMDSVGSFDNVFGVHKSLRGEGGGSSTLGGQMMDRQQDLSRTEMFTRLNNKAVKRLAGGLVQLMKMYYTTDHVTKVLGKEGAFEFIKLNQNDIEDGAVVEVKSGTPPTLDPVARYNQAIQLWQLQALDAESLFERLDFAQPREMAEKLILWRQGQLSMEAQAGAEASAMEAERDVETDANVINRAQRDLGGQGQAPLTNTPNQ